jgi:hypothetical protein
MREYFILSIDVLYRVVMSVFLAADSVSGTKAAARPLFMCKVSKFCPKKQYCGASFTYFCISILWPDWSCFALKFSSFGHFRDMN